MAQGDYLIEFWPRFASATAVRVPYLKRVQDLSGTDVPLVRSDLVEALTSYYVYNHLFGRFGDRRWKELADAAAIKYKELLEECLREDYDKHALPRSVQVQYPWLQDWGYFVSHDVP